MERADLVTTIFCLGHCILGLLEPQTISDTFNVFAYFIVALNFFTSFANTGGAIYMPKKLWYALLGYTLYTTVNLLHAFEVIDIPEFIVDLSFYQYYIMVLISLLLNCFYSESYTKPYFSSSNDKIEY